MITEAGTTVECSLKAKFDKESCEFIKSKTDGAIFLEVDTYAYTNIILLQFFKNMPVFKILQESFTGLIQKKQEDTDTQKLLEIYEDYKLNAQAKMVLLKSEYEEVISCIDNEISKIVHN